MNLKLSLAGAALALVTFAAAPASARNPCHDDAFKFCRAVIPDHARIQHCLERNMFHLTRACQAEFKR